MVTPNRSPLYLRLGRTYGGMGLISVFLILALAGLGSAFGFDVDRSPWRGFQAMFGLLVLTGLPAWLVAELVALVSRVRSRKR